MVWPGWTWQELLGEHTVTLRSAGRADYHRAGMDYYEQSGLGGAGALQSTHTAREFAESTAAVCGPLSPQGCGQTE